MKTKHISKFLFILVAGLFVTFFISNSNDKETDLIFSHKFHVIENDVECSTCHPDAETSESGTDDLLPKEEYCLNCHEKNKETCGNCHKNPNNPTPIPRITNYSPKFNHKKHIDKGYKCVECHKPVEQLETADEVILPTMQKCMTCHEVPDNQDGCYMCHTKEENLKPADHTELWLTNHGSFKASGGSANDCKTCHTENYCMDCHLGDNLFGESHPPEFITTHPLSYLMHESDCASCHGGYDYCIDCHTKVNYVVPPSHAFNWKALHQTEARSNAETCAVCHRNDEPRCMNCHDYIR